jgi:hypothetical protein
MGGFSTDNDDFHSYQHVSFSLALSAYNIEIRNPKSETISNIEYLRKGGSYKSHLLRHSGESRNPEAFENPRFRVALRPVRHAVQGFACRE